MMRGKAETQFAPAEEPDWKALRERCLALFERTKDLRVAVALCVAVLKTGDLLEFAEALQVVKGLLERYWEQVFPLLDPADNNDPTERVNIIAGLATPIGTFGDPIQLLARLRALPLTTSLQMGRFSLDDLMRSERSEPGPDGKPPIAAAQIQAAFRDSDAESTQAAYEAVSGCLDLVTQIDSVLTAAVGSDRAPDLAALPLELREIRKRLEPYAKTVVPSATGDAGEGQQTGGAVPTVVQSIAGEITSQADVLKTIDKICDYYKRTEPSSPVPYILKRARRLAEMDFMQIIGDLSPDSIKEIQRITGEPAEENE